METLSALTLLVAPSGSAYRSDFAEDITSIYFTIALEGPASHLCLVLIVCVSDEKKPENAGPPCRTRDWKIISTGYQIPTVFYRPNTVILKYRGIRLPT